MPRIAYCILDLGALKAKQSVEASFNMLGSDGWVFISLLPPQRALFKRIEPEAGLRDHQPVAAKYRDPETGQTWSGRGRMAVWLAERIRSGAKIEDFRA